MQSCKDRRPHWRMMRTADELHCHLPLPVSFYSCSCQICAKRRTGMAALPTEVLSEVTRRILWPGFRTHSPIPEQINPALRASTEINPASLFNRAQSTRDMLSHSGLTYARMPEAHGRPLISCCATFSSV